jgi:hypothetical protein
MAVILSSAFENLSSTENYYTKRFSARSSEYFFSRPALELRWEAETGDDRGNFYLYSPAVDSTDNSGSVYFYNRYSGKLKNLPNGIIPTVHISDLESEDLLISGSAEHVDTGIYKFTFCMTGSPDFYGVDAWKSGSVVYHSDEINFISRKNDQNSEYIFNITNIKPTYEQKESATLKIFSRKRDWSP